MCRYTTISLVYPQERVVWSNCFALNLGLTHSYLKPSFQTQCFPKCLLRYPGFIRCFLQRFHGEILWEPLPSVLCKIPMMQRGDSLNVLPATLISNPLKILVYCPLAQV